MLIEKLDSDTPFVELPPWYKGFSGEITKKEDGNY